MRTEQVHLTGERETLLGTLYARALDARSPHSLLCDQTAEETVRRIDYDFRKLGVRRRDSVMIALRARRLDLWTAEFIAEHPDATVLHLGCGLDSRVLRVNPPASVHWFDLDHPEVIELRRRLYPQRDGYHTIGSSVTDPSWLNEIPADRPAMIVAEGLTMYLSECDIRQLIERLTCRFPSGQLAFDACTRLGVRLTQRHPIVKATGACLGWGVDDPRALEQWIPGLEFVTELPYTDVPEIDALPLASRLLYCAMIRIPPLRTLARLLRYRF
jgi:O-methyltransferase involved in polyketide biosynthesis